MIHQLLTPTGKRLLLIQVPEDADEFKIYNGHIRFTGKDRGSWGKWSRNINTQNVVKDYPDAKIIGKLSEIEDFSEYVAWSVNPDGDKYYKNYTPHYDHHDAWFSNKNKTKDSFLSFLRKEGFVLEEPKDPFIDGLLLDEIKEKMYQQQLSKYINPLTTLLIEVK